jgi:hypothetical protein
MGAVFALFAAYYYWSPKILGKTYNELLGHVHFWTMFIGVNLTFLLIYGNARIIRSRSKICYMLGQPVITVSPLVGRPVSRPISRLKNCFSEIYLNDHKLTTTRWVVEDMIYSLLRNKSNCGSHLRTALNLCTRRGDLGIFGPQI